MNIVSTDEIERVKAKLRERPEPHPSVSHVKVSVDNYLAAAKFQEENGNLVNAIHNASVAEGIALALQAVAGVVAGRREGQDVRRAGLERIRLMLAELRERAPELKRPIH
jgi:hypothetical protein